MGNWREAEDALRAWAQELVGADVTVMDGQASSPGPSLALRLVDVAEPPLRRADRPAGSSVDLRFLVTARSDGAPTASDILETIYVAASQDGRYRVELGAAPLVAALGLPPQPAYCLAVTVAHDLAVERGPLVTEPLTTELGIAADVIEGRVLGPGGNPLVGALVTALDRGDATRTDGRGRFRIAALPSGAASWRLRVEAAGQTFDEQVDARGGGPVVIRCTIPEVDGANA